MAIVITTRSVLEKLALQEMRRHSGCESLAGVKIEVDPDGVWFIAPTDSTAKFSHEVQHAAEVAQTSLRGKYDLSLNV